MVQYRQGRLSLAIANDVLIMDDLHYKFANKPHFITEISLQII